ncbi:MAG: radical SAM protein, partial [Chitinispirillaceae bacterium]|nr:radical SAM protein [Chitinispirillaceae bacterium]
MPAGTERTAARTPGVPSVALLSIGCRTNQEEMAMLEHRLAAAGCTVASAPEGADIVVVNTCSVTAHAESKTLRLLHRLASLPSGPRIAVTGCLVQQKPHELGAMRNVAWVVGNARKQEIPALLFTRKPGVFIAPLSRRPLKEHAGVPAPAPGKRTRFAIKIQEGCDRACAYCIVPRLRGPSRSASPASVIETCRRAIDLGYKEIVLTGTHIGQYACKGGLGALLERLLSCAGDFRIRLSSLDPRELSAHLLSLVGREER